MFSLATVFIAVKLQKPSLLGFSVYAAVTEGVVRTLSCLIFSSLVGCDDISDYELEIIIEILQFFRLASTSAGPELNWRLSQQSNKDFRSSVCVYGMAWNGVYAFAFFGLFKVKNELEKWSSFF